MKRLINSIVAGAVLLAGSTALAAGPDDERVVVVKAQRIVTVSGDVIENGEVVIVDGVIELVGRSLEYPRSAEVIETHTVMPGLIHARSRTGLGRYTRNGINGDKKMADEVLLEDIDFEPLLEAGYTAVCLYPNGGGIPGRSAVFRTAGPDDARVLDDANWLRVNMQSTGRDKPALRNALKKAKSEIEKADKAREEWDKKQEEARKKAEAEAKQKEQGGEEKKEPDAAGRTRADEEKPAEEQKPEEFKPPAISSGFAELVAVLRNDEDAARLMIEVGQAAGIIHVEDVMKQWEDVEFDYYLDVRGFPDYSYSVERLAESGARVLTQNRMFRKPSSTVRDNVIARLVRGGCEVSLVPRNDGRNELLAQRPKLVDLIRHGLPADKAIAMVTLNPAKLLGLEATHGSIEKGRAGDLVLLDGDELDPHTRVERVLILGEVVWELENGS